MIGLQFEQCSPFGLSLSFENCTLNHASFFKNKLKGTHFSNTNLSEVDFTGTDLSSAVFDQCNLAQAIFESANLEKADFRTASNYSMDLDKNKVKNAQFSLSGTPGLLAKYRLKITS
jgi:uncharacterized protein YjbI with pentapeptide repeats